MAAPEDPASDFDVRTEAGPVKTILHVKGELDHLSAPRLATAGDMALGDHPHRTIAIDMSGVTFVDSGGLGALVGLYTRALDQGTEVRLTDCSAHVRRILEITGLDQFLDIGR